MNLSKLTCALIVAKLHSDISKSSDELDAIVAVYKALAQLILFRMVLCEDANIAKEECLKELESLIDTYKSSYDEFKSRLSLDTSTQKEEPEDEDSIRIGTVLFSNFGGQGSNN